MQISTRYALNLSYEFLIEMNQYSEDGMTALQDAMYPNRQAEEGIIVVDDLQALGSSIGKGKTA